MAGRLVLHGQEWRWTGTDGLVPRMANPEALHRRLRELGGDYLLILREHGIRLPRGAEWRRRFHRIHSDARADVYEIK